MEKCGDTTTGRGKEDLVARKPRHLPLGLFPHPHVQRLFSILRSGFDLQSHLSFLCIYYQHKTLKYDF